MNVLTNNRMLKSILIKFFSISLLVAVVAGITLYLVATQKQIESTPKTEVGWQINAIQADRQSYNASQRLYGRLYTERVIRLVAPVSAEIKAVTVASGQSLSANQTVAILDQQSLVNAVARIELQQQQTELEIKQTKASLADQRALLAYDQQLLELQKNNLDRISKLKQLNNSSLRDLEIATETHLNRQAQVIKRNKTIADLGISLQQLQASLQSVQVDLDDAKRNLGKTEIKTPEAGLVVTVAVQTGSRVGVNATVAEVLPLEQLEFEALLINRQLPQIFSAFEQNQPIVAEIELFGQSYTARLDRLKGDSETAGQVGIFVIDQVSDSMLSRVRPNLIATLMMTLPMPTQSIAVPYSALYGVDKLFVVREGRLESVQVAHLGSVNKISNESPWALVESDQIANGEQIMITHLPNAYSGMKVTTIN